MTSIISIRLRNNETQAWYSKVLLQLNLLVIACLTPIKMSIAKGNSCNLEVWFGCPTFRPDFCPYSYGGTSQSIYYELDHKCPYVLYWLFQKPIFSPAGFKDGATIKTIQDILYFTNFRRSDREKHKSDGTVLKNYEIVIFLWHQLFQ